MKMTEQFLAQLEREEAGTRSALERVPEGRNDWKPHPKSMPFGYLAALVASMPSWIVTIVEKDELDLSKGGSQSEVKTRRELLQLFDESMAAARRTLARTSDEHLMTSWRLVYGERVLSESSRQVMIVDGVFSHLAHHRGQLTVYLRLNEVPVPAIYGASADTR